MVAFQKEVGPVRETSTNKRGASTSYYESKLSSSGMALRHVPEQQLPSPETFGWRLDGDKWVPVMTTLTPAPDAVVQLVRCGCTKSKCSSNRCSCRKANLNCTDLCSCFDVDDMTENKLEEDEYDDDSEDLSYESDDSDSDS